MSTAPNTTKLSMTKLSNKKKKVIAQLLDIQDRVSDVLAELCRPCPKCCPPSGPCDPGEVYDYGRGEIYMCDRCSGRGYLIPKDL